MYEFFNSAKNISTETIMQFECVYDWWGFCGEYLILGITVPFAMALMIGALCHYWHLDREFLDVPRPLRN